MLVFTTIATVIFWRRSEDRMALFSAFMFVVFGGAALTSGVPQTLAAAHPTLKFQIYATRHTRWPLYQLILVPRWLARA
jgi:hypothetical protein